MSDEIHQSILIIGAGAMGRLWAAHLQQTHSVCFATRAAMVAGIDYDIVKTDGSEQAVSIPAYTNKSQPDLVLVTTKAPDAEKALASTLPLLAAKAPIVLFQNGMGSQQAIARRFSDWPVLAASTTEGAFISHVGQVVHAGTGSTWVGGLTARGQNALTNVVNRLRRNGLQVEADPAIEDRLWQKLAINAGINPFTAILDCCNGDILGQAFFEDRIGSVCHEVSRLMRVYGVPVTADTLEQRVREVAQSTAANSSSMRQDVRAKKPTEIDMMNGFVVRESAIRGWDTPVNQELTDTVKALY